MSEHHPSRFHLDARLKVSFLAVGILTFMVAINSTALAVAIPLIAADLNGTALEAFWVGTSFLMTEAIFMAPFSRVSDFVGRVPVLNFTMGLFLIGTIVSSTAPSMTILILGRGIQGAGSGGIAVLSEIVVTDLVPLRARGNYFSIISALWTIGDVAGPILGGMVASRASWKWIFWCNVPVAVAAIISTNLFLQHRPMPGSYWQKARQIDWVGMAILISAFTSLLIGLTWGGVLHAWTSPSTIVPIAMGLLGAASFVIYEKQCAAEPLIRFELFGNYNIIYALYGAFFHTVLVLGLIYILPLYFEAVHQVTSLEAAFQMIPYGITLAPFSGLAGLIVGRGGDICWVIRAGQGLAMLGSGLLILLNTQTPLWQSALIIACVGAGLGLLYNTLLLLAQAAIDERSAALAVTVLNLVRYLGQAIGVAMVGVIFQNRMSIAMLSDPQLAPYASRYATDAAALIGEIKMLGEGEFKEKLISAYAESLTVIWISMCAFCILPLLGSFFLRQYCKSEPQSAEN